MINSSALGTNKDNGGSSFVELILVALVLLLCCLCSGFEAASYISLIAFFFHLAVVLYRNPYITLKYLVIFFGIVSNLIGCFACEFSGEFIPEMGVYSEYVGALPMLVLCQWTFMQLIAFFDYRAEKKRALVKWPEAGEGSLWSTFLNVAILILCVWLFLRVAGNPSFGLGYDRFKYAQTFLTKIDSTLAGWLNFLIIIPLLSWRRSRSKIAAVSILIYILYELWVGNKFGAFLNLAWVVALVYYDRIRQIEIKRMRAALVAIGCVVVLMVGIAVGLESNIVTKGPMEYLGTRTAQQGELWWRVYSQYGGGGHADEFHNEIESMLNPKNGIAENVGSRNGIYLMMYLAGPNDLVDYRLGGGSRYTEAGFISAYYYFGVPGGLLFAVLMAALFSLFVNGLMTAMGEACYLESAIWLRMVFFTETLRCMFTFSVYTTPLSLACLAYLGVVALIRLSRSRRKMSLCELRFRNE